MNEAPAVGYSRVYSLVDDIAGDGTAAAANFNAMQLGLYAQDEIAVSDRFNLSLGLRVDVPFITDDPAEAPRFNSEVLPRLASQYPEFADNVQAGSAPEGQLMFSPRIGFNYNLDDTGSSKLRGGVGLFTSRIPFVWPGAMFNTNGVTSTFIGDFAISEELLFRPDIQNQYVFENPTIPSGDLNLFTNDFRYPQVLRGNLAYDTRVGDGWNLGLEAIYTKTINNINYTNINTSSEIDALFTGSGDDRPIFVNSEIDEDDFGAVYVGSNTSEGFGFNLTGTLSKRFAGGFGGTVAYTYGDSHALSEGTSSQNSSQWRGQVNIDGRNNPSFGRSDFALGSRVLAAIDYSVDWGSASSTTISLFYNGQSGLPFSYVIGGDRDARNLNNQRGSTSRWRSLVYVPSGTDDINLVEF